MTLFEFYEIFNIQSRYTVYHTNDTAYNTIIKHYENKINSLPNIKIYTNTEVIKLKKNTVIIKNNNLKQIKSDITILAVPPLALTKLLQQSDPHIRHNWGRTALLESYSSIGVQMHFDYGLPAGISKDWCWSCMTEWRIIAVITSEYIPTEKTGGHYVISATVLDNNLYSSYLKKYVKDCQLFEIEQEVWRQLKDIIYQNHNVILSNPIKITTTPGMYKENNKLPLSGGNNTYNNPSLEGNYLNWVSQHTGYALTVIDESRINRSPKGYEDIGVYVVGAINNGLSYPSTSFENAVESAMRFVNSLFDIKTKFGKEKHLTHKKMENIIFGLLYLIIFGIYYFLIYL